MRSCRLTIHSIFLSIVACAAIAQEPPKEQSAPLAEPAAVKKPIPTNDPVSFKFERGFKQNGIIAIELSPDGSLVATGGLEKDIRLISTKDWKTVATTAAPRGMVLDLVFSKDGKYLISCGDPKQVLVLETKDLKVVHDYTLPFRPERIVEGPDGLIAAVGSHSGMRSMLAIDEKSQVNESIHKSFIGGACSSKSPRIVYTAGDQSVGPYFLARKINSLQKIVKLPGRPARVTLGRDDREVLVTTESKALVVDVMLKKVIQTWELPEAKKVEDIIYWAERDLYVTSDKQGMINLWMRGRTKPVASHQVSKFDVYQVIALDEDRLMICGRQNPNSMSIWKLEFDLEKLPKPQIAAVKSVPAEPLPQIPDSPPTIPSETDVPKTAPPKMEQPKTASDATQSGVKKPTAQPKPRYESSPWVKMNPDFEVRRISPGELGLRKNQPSTMAELEWKLTQLEASGKPVPEELKTFEPLEIWDAIVSPKGKLFLATNDGLASYNGEQAEFIRHKNSEIVKARSLARDPVDGILIGQQGGHRVFELRESGKLVSRGVVAPEPDEKTDLSVKKIVASGSDYLALASSAVYRRLSDGSWVKENLQTSNPIVNFELLASREIATCDENTNIVIVHSNQGNATRLILNKSMDANHVLAKSTSLTPRKMIAGRDGELFCVFAKSRNPSLASARNPFEDSNTVNSGCCNLYGSSYNDIVTSNQIDWSVEGMPEKDRTIVDFLPAPSGESGEVWFVLPHGLGLYSKKKTQFWKSQFPLSNDVELSRIQNLGNGSFMVFTTDGVHSHDIFYIRRK